MTLTRRHLGLGAIALGATAALPPAAHAEAFAIRMMGQHR